MGIRKVDGKMLATAIALMAFSNLIHGDVGDADSNSRFFLDPQQAFYVESNLEFTLLHEIAHAVFDMNNIPIFGGQEIAADQVAVMLMITHNHGVDGTLMNRMLAISDEWMMQWHRDVDSEATVFWDSHPLPIQRFYDISCLVYGADPQSLETVRKESRLPIERAWGCDQEYTKSRQALSWLTKRATHVEFDHAWNLTKQTPKTKNRGSLLLDILPPITRAGDQTYEFLKGSARLAYLVSRTNKILKLDRDIHIVLDPGCGKPDSWWDSQHSSIFICYDLLAQFVADAKQAARLNKELDYQSNPTIVLNLPYDVRQWMEKEYISPADLNVQIIDWIREKNQPRIKAVQWSQEKWNSLGLVKQPVVEAKVILF